MRFRNLFIMVLFGLTALLTACASTTYKEFVGGREVVGQGGTRELIDGVEVWENGAPNRPFRVIGIIDDQRDSGTSHKRSLVNIATKIIKSETRISDIAKKTKEVGGDAVIIYAEDSVFAGFISDSYSETTGSATAYGNSVVGSASTTTSGYTSPVTLLKTKGAVIKYTK